MVASSRLNKNAKSQAKSCGCLSKQALKDGREIFKVVDKTGRKYGRLTVLHRDFEKEKTCKGVYWRCLCDCGNYTSVASHNLREGQFGTQSCGKCRSSHGQNKIRDILKENNINFIEEYRFPDCKNIRPLPFDFFLPDYNCCIEFDGEQHYKSTGGWNSEEHVEKVKNNDEIKNQYCKDNNITLIRIPYFDYDNIQLSNLLPSNK